MTPQNQDLGGRCPSLPEPESGQRDQIDQQSQKYLESRDHGFMMPHLPGMGTSTVAIDLMRSTGGILSLVIQANGLGELAYLRLRAALNGIDDRRIFCIDRADTFNRVQEQRNTRNR